MEHKHGVTVYWGLLLSIYWSILFGGVMVSRTSEFNEALLTLLLAAGVPLYFLAARTIMGRAEVAARISEDASLKPRPSIISFPRRAGPETEDDVAPAARTPHLRKLG